MTSPAMRFGRRAALLSLGAVGAYSGLALVAACSGSTSGSRVVLVNRVAPSTQEFTNALGWQIRLDRALTSIGPLSYLQGAPVGGVGLLRGLVRTAHAHPGHFEEGGVLAEMLEATSVDLLAGSNELALGQGVTGIARSARFSWQSPAAGPFADALGSNVVLVDGSASRDGTTLSFRATATEGEVLDTDGDPAVTGCPLSNGAIEADGTITMTVDVGLWLDQVDFGDLPASDERTELSTADRAQRSFARGLVKAAAYSFRYEPTP